MEEKKDSIDLDVTDMLDENYVPSETERKKVIIHYFFIGILICLNRKDITRYEFFHLRQAIWWWTIFFISFIASIFFFFIPYMWFIPALIFMLMFWVWIVFVKQAWEWKYSIEINGKHEVVLFPFFVWAWNWILETFDVKYKIEK